MNWFTDRTESPVGSQEGNQDKGVMWTQQFHIRRAEMIDVKGLRQMQERSMRIIGGRFYDTETIESFLRTVGTMDDAVVAEGHFFAAIDFSGHYAGSAGWSRRMPGYASHGIENPGEVDVDHGPAVVRSVFVDPDRARAGIGLALMQAVEMDAWNQGIQVIGLTATLSGLAFYQSCGYRAVGEGALDLGDALALDYVVMTKPLIERDAMDRSMRGRLVS